MSLFIATPTHICKRYCAWRFVQGIIDATKNLDSSINPLLYVANNSRGDAAKYYNSVILSTGIQNTDTNNKVKYLYNHLSLPDDFYGQRDSIHRRLVYTVNFLRDRFLESNYEYFLSLESDVLLNNTTLNMMLNWIYKYPIIHANCYPGFHKQTEACIVDRVTLGCTLIHREVIEKISFRYDPSLLAAHHDAFFAHDCNSQGHTIFYLPQAITEHMHDDRNTRGWNALPKSER